MRDINLTMIIDCCRYAFFLRRNPRITLFGLDWAAHAPNFWICDGIIPEGDRAREISNALDSEITFEGDDSLLGEVFAKMAEHSESSYLLVEDEDYGNIDKYKKRPYRWISITSKNKVLKDNMQTILATASSVFLSFDKTSIAPRLPSSLFKHCSKLGVLILSYCAFNFASPPFLHCNTLRFLGLGNCTNQNKNTSELEGGDCITEWTLFLHSLWVLDLRYTDWGEILCEQKIGLMANLIELNIEGVRCWQYTGQLLEKRLPYLQRLRIIKPTHQEEPSMNNNNSLVDKKQLEILDLSGNSDMKILPGSLSEASKLQVLVLDGCDGIENVLLHNSLLKSFSFDGYGPASHWTSTGKIPPMSSRPECRPSVVDNKDVRVSKISLEGCTLLEDLFLRGLPNLEELDLSGCAIKVLDFGSMVMDVPRLKRLFLLGCENLRAIKWGSDYVHGELELIYIDTRPGSKRVHGCARPLSLGARQKYLQRQVHAIFVDARLARSLFAPIFFAPSDPCFFNISVTSSATCMETIQPETTMSNETVGSSCHQRHYEIAARGVYCDIFTKVGNEPTPMQTFPKGPTGQLDHHIEIGDGSHSLQREIEANALGSLMTDYTESLHVHDVSTCSNATPTANLRSLRWCRVERCPNLHAVFPPGAEDYYGNLETIWASDLLMARCVWSKGFTNFSVDRFRSLRHLHLRCCPSLQFGLAMGERPSFPSLETLHIIHCGNLMHIFVPADKRHKWFQHTSIKFPKLTTIHLHDLPALQQICEAAAEVLAPALETIKIRGCWSLRQLPALKGRKAGMRRPVVEIEKDVWDALKWDGVDAGHHPSLYEAPVHSRYYKRRTLRTTVLR